MLLKVVCSKILSESAIKNYCWQNESANWGWSRKCFCCQPIHVVLLRWGLVSLFYSLKVPLYLNKERRVDFVFTVPCHITRQGKPSNLLCVNWMQITLAKRNTCNESIKINIFVLTTLSFSRQLLNIYSLISLH